MDRRTVWELFKYEIRRYSMQYGARKKKAQQQALDILRLRLKQLECDMSDFAELKEDYYEVCEQIKACEQVEAQGVIVRSKVQFIEENEKCTKYFFDIEKRNYVKKNIRKLEIDGNTEITDPDVILEYERSFYQALYTECIETETVLSNDLLVQDMNKLKCDQRESCEVAKDKDECLKF